MPRHLSLRWSLGLLATALAAAPDNPPGEVLQLKPMTVTEHAPLRKEPGHELLTARYGAAAVSLGDYIYIIGGSNDTGTPLDSIERFDPRTGRAEEFARLRVARRDHSAVVVGGRIYVLGGNSRAPVGPTDANGDLIIDEPDKHSIVYGSTTEADPAPGDFMKAPSRGWLNPLESTVEVIDPATRSVVPAPLMPVAKARFACAALGGRIQVMGGLRQRGGQYFTTNTTEDFDPSTGQWSAGINMPTPRQSCATVVGDFIVVAGGRQGTTYLSVVESYFPAGKVWHRLPALGETFEADASVFLGHQLFLFGSSRGPNRIMAYDLERKSSLAYKLSYENAQYAAAVVHDGKIYLLGGTTVEGTKALRAIQIFAPVADAPVPGK